MTLKKEKGSSLDNFKIFETNQFLKDFTHDFSGQQERIKKKLKNYVYPQSRQNPYYGKNIKKLKDYKPDTWRYRIGNHRFFYTINGHKKTIFMIASDTRENAY